MIFAASAATAAGCLPGVLKGDINDFFPSISRQLGFDMFAGKASCDYPHTDIRKGDDMPLVIALYGEKTSLVCHHPSREVALFLSPLVSLKVMVLVPFALLLWSILLLIKLLSVFLEQMCVF